MATAITKRADASCDTDEEEDLYDEDEEEVDEDELTDVECANCCGNIQLGADTVKLEMSYPYWDEAEAKVKYWHIVDQFNEPRLAPIFFCYECWESVKEEASERLGDMPPVEEQGAVICCDHCSSTIRIGEVCITEKLGELHRGRLDATPFIENDGEPYLMCLRCAHEVYDAAELQGYESVMNQNGECRSCTAATCWRVGRCMCNCHHR